MDNSRLPILTCTLVISSRNNQLSSLSERLFSEATLSRTAEDFPDVSKKAGLSENYCEYTVKREKCTSINDVILDLFERYVDVHKEEIRHLSFSGWKVSVVIIVHMLCGDGPEMVLSSNAVHTISHINGEVCIDLYDYDEPHDFRDQS